MNFYDKMRVKENQRVKLGKISANPPENYRLDKKRTAEILQANRERLLDLQYQLYAEGKQSLLIVVQALDTGGKDGVINHVFASMNPQGCRTKSFKVPSSLEASHDFLWRAHAAAPAQGEVMIFNRSHYEDVLVSRVRNLVPKTVWKQRYGQINEFESLLQSNGTKVIKFFLHIDKDEQLRRFGERLENKSKHWKISESDYAERGFWDEYTTAFEEALAKCSTKDAPWFIIPANSKSFRNLAVSEILIHTMQSMNIKMPEPKVDIEKIRKLYEAELAKSKKK